MILGWSPYSGAGEGPPKAAVNYLLGAAVQKRIGSAPETLRRDPPPELLIGNPTLTLMALNALRTKHRYSVATLSFDAGDIDAQAFNAGDPLSRRQIGQTLNLFFESAYCGIPPAARLHPLVGTHTHTGRLEVNILMPRAVWRAMASIASHNPHPPMQIQQKLWHHYLDTINGRFDWADPMAHDRRQLIKLPDWLTKMRREAERQGLSLPATGPEQVAALAKELWAKGNVPDREALINFMALGLGELGVRVHKVNDKSVRFESIKTGEHFRVGGLLFSFCFSLANPAMTMSAEELARLRRRDLETAPARLLEALRRRARGNSERFGFQTCPVPEPLEILAQPGLELPPCHPATTGDRLVRYAQPIGAAAHAAVRTEPRASGNADRGVGSPRPAARNRTGGADDHARLLGHAAKAAGLFAGIRRYLSQILSAWRRRQASLLLATRLAAQTTRQWHELGNRLETLNEPIVAPFGMARTADRTAQADRADRTASGIAGARGDAGSLGTDRPICGRNHPGGGPGGTGGPSDGGRKTDTRSDQVDSSGVDGATTRHHHDTARPGANSPAAGRTPGRPEPLTRAQLICLAWQIARENEIEVLRLSFMRNGDQGWLRMESKGLTVLLDRHGQVAENDGDHDEWDLDRP